jgi:hypothetical protein
MMFSQENHVVSILDPVADAFSATPTLDIVNVSGYNHCTFLVWWGVGATGTVTFTVEASDDVSGSNVSAVEFSVRRQPTSTNVQGALSVNATTYATTAGSSQIYIIEVDVAKLGATGYKFLKLKGVELVDSPILGGVLAILSQPRYAGAIMPAAIA